MICKQNKTYKFRIYPTEEQALVIHKTFGCVRFVYNKMLAERKETYESLKEGKEALKKIKRPTPATYKKAYEWLKEVDSLANHLIWTRHIKHSSKEMPSSQNSKVNDTSKAT